jgi:hypothetical protein
MNREVSHEGLQPRVPVSMVKDASGGNRKSGSIAAGMRFRVDILEREKFRFVRILIGCGQRDVRALSWIFDLRLSP